MDSKKDNITPARVIGLWEEDLRNLTRLQHAWNHIRNFCIVLEVCDVIRFFLPCQGTIGSAGPQGSKGDRGATVSVQKLSCQWAISESPLASTSKRGFIDRFFTWRHYIHFWCTKQWNGGQNFLLFRAICMVTDHESENNPYHKCKSPLASFSEWGWVQSCYHA